VRLQLAIPEAHVSADVLDSALEASTRLNSAMVAKREVPTFSTAVKAGRVKWAPEPPGAERFDHARTVLGRGWGDCDDLAPWQAASLRVTGVDPGATANVVKSGPNRWHAIVKRSDGTIEDPSRQAGMGSRVSGVAPAVCPLMFNRAQAVVGAYGGPPGRARPAFAVRTTPGGYEGRCDLPWDASDYALTALQTAPVAAQALTGAILGAVIVGDTCELGNEEDIATLLGVGMILDGHDPREIVAVIGEHSPRAVRRIANMMPQLKGAFSRASKSRKAARAVGHALGSPRGYGRIGSMLAQVRV
jgi:hypothetical protein